MIMKIAIYSRKSKFTGKGESIENQIDLCRQYIHIHFDGISDKDIVIYEDEGYSGGNTDRPQFKQMMADTKQKKFSALVCYRLDRISRNIGDFAKLIEDLNSLSISFISIREQFDTNSPMGRAMMYIASVFSQLERETTAERIRDNMQELAKTGRWLGGTTPTGYVSKPVEKVTIDGKTRKAYKLIFKPDEIKTVKLIYKKFLETNSLTQVETFLMQNNILSKTGKLYTRFTIKSILENPVYMIADKDTYNYFSNSGVELCAQEKDFDGSYAIMAYNKTLQKHGRATRIRNISNWIVAIGKHQGIISGAKWVQVQKMLNQNKAKSYRKPKSNTALLSGLLRCGKCGSYMRPKLSQRKNANGELIYTYLCELKEKSHGYNCSIKNVNGNILDKAVCSEIIKLSEDSSVLFKQLRSCSESFNNTHEAFGAELDSLKKSLDENNKKITNLVNALENAKDSPASGYITKQINELHNKNAAVKSRIEELKNIATPQFLPNEQIDIIKNILSSFSSAFNTMSVEEKRSALRTFIDKIVWDGENVDIYLFGTGIEAPLVSIKSKVIPQCVDSK